MFPNWDFWGLIVVVVVSVKAYEFCILVVKT